MFGIDADKEEILSILSVNHMRVSGGSREWTQVPRSFATMRASSRRQHHNAGKQQVRWKREGPPQNYNVFAAGPLWSQLARSPVKPICRAFKLTCWLPLSLER